jgi:hypothetical protein
MYKLFVNAIFGKMIEQVRSYLECKICTTSKSFKKAISSVRFQNFKIINTHTVVVFSHPASIRFNKAYPIGFSVLELSKYFMFKQYYEEVKPRLGDCEVLFSDTDSLALAVFSKKKCNNIKKLRDIIDFSNYPPTHAKYSRQHANALGFWKDELCGEKLDEYVGLRSKCYAMNIKKSDKFTLKSTCKGVRKGYRKTIPFPKFRRCVQTIDQLDITQYNIQSRNHVVSTMKLKKVCFGSFDDKRYLFQCGIHSVPYGSVHINDTCAFCM